MEKLFGEYLIKCKVLAPPEAAEEEKKEEVADPDDQPADAGAFYPYEKVSVEDALIRTTTSHVVVFFTAEYCPPCQGFM